MFNRFLCLHSARMQRPCSCGGLRRIGISTASQNRRSCSRQCLVACDPGRGQVRRRYLTVDNKGSTADKLIGGSSSAAGKVEVHEMAMNNGVMTMRPVKDGLSIPAGKSVTLAPGGYHLMLMELKAPFKKGDKIPVTLKFEKAGDVNVTLDVRDIGATAPASGQMDHVKPGMGHKM